MFANLGVENPSGIDYPNKWLDEAMTRLKWYGKRNRSIDSGSSKKLIDANTIVHVFYREEKKQIGFTAVREKLRM